MAKGGIKRLSQAHDPSLPFNYEQKFEIVANFIQAFVGGQVRLLKLDPKTLSKSTTLMWATFAASENLAAKKAKTLEKMSGEDWELEYVTAMQEKAEILMGTREASVEEVRAAVDFMLRQIWLNRHANQMEGEFMAVADLKDRVAALEREIQTHHGALEEIRILMRAALGTGGGPTH
jgi:hypothetical protein